MVVTTEKTIQNRFAYGVFLILAVPLVLWFFYDGAWGQLVTYGPSSDIWEHVAVVKAWSENILNPAHPHMNVEAGSPRFTPLYLFYTLIVAVSGLPPLQIVGWAGILHFVVFLIGLHWFTRTYYRSAWAPVFALIIMLTFWGMGWGWSNAYDLRSLILVASYPSIGAFSLSFVLFGLVCSLMRQERALTLLHGMCFGALVFLIVLSHPLTAIFSGVFVLALLWFERGYNPDNAKRLLVCGAIACGVTMLWPWYSLAGVLFENDLGWQANWLKLKSVFDVDRIAKTNSYGRRQYFYTLDQLVLRGGVGLICFLSIFWVWKYMARYRAIVVVAGVFIGLWGVNAVLPIALGHRFFFFAFVAAHLALVAVFVEAVRCQVKWLRFGFICAVFLSLSVFGAQKVDKTFKGYMRKIDISFDRQASASPVALRNHALAHYLNADAVVATDLTTAFSLPAFAGKVLVAKRGYNFVEDKWKRKKDLAIILAPDTVASTRTFLLDEYHVTDLIVTSRNTSPALIDYCHASSVNVIAVGDDLICKLKPVTREEGAGV